MAGLTQAFNHGTHHRGQLTAAMARMGKAVSSTDVQAVLTAEEFQSYLVPGAGSSAA